MSEGIRARHIAVDAMGGDHGPGVIVDGALQAVRELGVQVRLIGDEAAIRAEISRHGADGDARVEVTHTSEVIEMAEHPATAVRQKTDSSIVVGMRQVKAGQAAAFVSAGKIGRAHV